MPHALIVDDDLSFLLGLAEVVGREGFTTATASSVAQARAEVAKQAPDVLLTDLQLPDGSGLDLLQDNSGAGAPEVILITGHASVETAVDALKRGAADYLTKPVDRGKLIHSLRSICGTKAGKVLLVDDDDVVRRSVRLALEPIGWQVVEAENGEVALDALTAARPDAIILDLMMPKMDGFEFLGRVRASSGQRDVPVVVLTARDLTEEDRSRLAGGVERIIQKGGRDEMLRQVADELRKCVKRNARHA
jgi:DNA-binding response OmpR family regulator